MENEAFWKIRAEDESRLPTEDGGRRVVATEDRERSSALHANGSFQKNRLGPERSYTGVRIGRQGHATLPMFSGDRKFERTPESKSDKAHSCYRLFSDEIPAANLIRMYR